MARAAWATAAYWPARRTEVSAVSRRVISDVAVTARSSSASSWSAVHSRGAALSAHSAPSTCPSGLRSGCPAYAPIPSSVTAGLSHVSGCSPASSTTSGASLSIVWRQIEYDSGVSRAVAHGSGEAIVGQDELRRSRRGDERHVVARQAAREPGDAIELGIAVGAEEVRPLQSAQPVGLSEVDHP